MTSMTPILIHETPAWLVLAKPAGWLTIPPSPGKENAAAELPVLSTWARAQYGDLWIVHRLDRDTSGVVLFARTPESHRQASQWFQKHQVKKAYDFLAPGALAQPMLRVKAPVRGAPSLTQVELKEKLPGAFLGRAVPLTGRRHQIRIHLASLGHPLLGDPEYGGATTLGRLEIARVALHSARLEIPDGVVFEAPWPEDFTSWVRELRNG